MARSCGPLHTSKDVVAALQRSARDDKATFLPKYFQCHAGGYGEGDQFLGVVVPDQRRVACAFGALPHPEIAKLLGSNWHECRSTGLFILVGQFERSQESEASRIFELLLDCFEGLNNWDLVDTAGPKIVGPYLLAHPPQQQLLSAWSKADHLWYQRLAMVSTMAFIKQDKFDWTVKLAKGYLSHTHDLIHKSTGWMLREMGNRSESSLIHFLDTHASSMPRTMLRYAIEKLPKPVRQAYMASTT